MEIDQTERQKKEKKKLFPGPIIEDCALNDVTFNQPVQLYINSETRREENSSLIVPNNDQISQYSPSLNFQNLQVSQASKLILNTDKIASQCEKSDLQDSNQESADKDSPTIIQQGSSVPRSSKHSRSIFLSQPNKNHIKKVKNNMKIILSLRESQAEKKFLNFKLLNSIHKKMIYFMKNFTPSGRSKQINDENQLHIRRVINDRGDYIQKKQKNKFVQLVRNVIDFLMCFKVKKRAYQYKSCFMIVPNSLFNLLTLILFCSLNSLFYFFLSIFIVYEGYMTYEKSIVLFIVATWTLEIFFQVNTQIYNKTNLISDRDKILAQYIKQRALYDLIPLAALIIQPQGDNILKKIFLGITFLKVKNVMNDINQMQKLLCMSVKNYYIIQLFNLLFKITAISHVVACIWYLVGKIELNLLGYETTWYDNSLGADGVWWKLYLESMYWSLTLMTTGSNIATSIPQMLFTSFIMLFTTIIFGYMLNTTGVILQQLDQIDENKRKDLNILNDYMRQNRISKGLQGRVNLDLEYQYLHNLKKDHDQKYEVISKISPHLQNLLKLEYCKQALEKFGFIYKKFSKDTIQELSLEFQEEFYSPNQVIFAEKQVNDLSLIWIVQGQVQTYQSYQGYEKSKQPLQTLKQGDIIGQVNFFTGLEFQYSVRSVDFTKILKISRNKFIEIVEKRKKDYEIFCYIRDQQQLYQEYQILQSSCVFCGSYSHLNIHCNLVHIEKQNLFQKVRFIMSHTQPRSKYVRKRVGVNSYMIRQEISKTVQKYCHEARKEQKITKLLERKQKHQFISNESDDDDSDDSIPMISTFQMISSNLSSEGELDQTVDEAQQVKNQSYFYTSKLINLNQNKKKKKNDGCEDRNEPNQQTTQQLQLDFISKYSAQMNKRNSILSVDVHKKRHSFQIPENLSKKIINSTIENVHKRNSIQFLDLRNQNSCLIDDSNALQKGKMPQIQEYNGSRSNSMQKQDYQQTNTLTTIEKIKTSNLGSPEKMNNSKKIENSKRIEIENKQKLLKKLSSFQKQNSLNPAYEDEMREKRKPFFMFDFEKQKNWLIYFPQGNIRQVLTRYSKYQKRKQKFNQGGEKKQKEKAQDRKYQR